MIGEILVSVSFHTSVKKRLGVILLWISLLGVILVLSSVFRCDSRNLNLSPLCDLGSHTKPQAWAKEVKEVYDKDRSAFAFRCFTHMDKLSVTALLTMWQGLSLL